MLVFQEGDQQDSLHSPPTTPAMNLMGRECKQKHRSHQIVLLQKFHPEVISMFDINACRSTDSLPIVHSDAFVAFRVTCPDEMAPG